MSDKYEYLLIDENVFFVLYRNIRGSADAQHTNENLFITIIRPMLVELVNSIRHLFFFSSRKIHLDRYFSISYACFMGWMWY